MPEVLVDKETGTILIELSSYNLEEAEKAVVIACVQHANNSGGMSKKDIANLLGCSDSHVGRLIRENNIEHKKPNTALQDTIQSGIKALEQLGYTIIKKK
jgi:DNA invertase Pin-like site-specific DNA recombinase